MSGATNANGNSNGNGRFRLGACIIEPGRDRIQRGDEEFAIHPREMDLLVFLVEKEGGVASIGEIVDAVWKGGVVTDHSVYYAIHQLRAALDDPDADRSTIETIPRKGYRLTEKPEPIEEPFTPAEPPAMEAQQPAATVRVFAGFLMFALAVDADRPPAPPLPPDDVSIAVLSFDDLGIEPDNQYLVEAVPGDLTTTLSRICDSRIASRTSARAVEAAGYGVPTLAKRLNVRYVLEGGVQQSGDQFRISARLVEAASDRLVWAGEFGRELSTPDLFWVQENIVRDIARKLEASVCPGRASPAPHISTASREAYRLLQFGKRRFDERVTPAVIESVAYFKRAIEQDPNYAEAYARLARAYRYLVLLGIRVPEGLQADILKLLERALEIDRSLAIAHVEMAFAMEWEDNLERAIAEFEHALELEPGNVDTYEAAAVLLDHDRELELYLQALDIDPLSPDILLDTAVRYRALGEHKLAEDYFRQAIESEAGFVLPWYGLGMLAWRDGRLDESIRLHRKAHAIEPSFWRSVWITGLIYLDLGDDAEAERWFRRAQQMDDSAPRGLPLVFHWRGDHRREFELYDADAGEWPSFAWSDRLTHLIADGRLKEAEALLRREDPGAFDSDITWTDIEVDMAYRRTMNDYLLQRTGRAGGGPFAGPLLTAAILLDRSGKSTGARRIWGALEAWYENCPDWRWRDGDAPALGAAIFASQGKADRAIEELQAAVDNGWRAGWWLIESRPDFDPIQDDRRFQAIIEQLRADTARQLAHVRAMEASGEIAPMQPLPPAPVMP